MQAPADQRRTDDGDVIVAADIVGTVAFVVTALYAAIAFTSVAQWVGAITAMLLARETKGLLLGEAAQRQVVDDILRVAGADPDVRCANGVITDQLGPQSIVVALSADFHDALTTPQIEACILRIERAVQARHPDVVALFVKPQTAQTWRRRSMRPGCAKSAFTATMPCTVRSSTKACADSVTTPSQCQACAAAHATAMPPPTLWPKAMNRSSPRPSRTRAKVVVASRGMKSAARVPGCGSERPKPRRS